MHFVCCLICIPGVAVLNARTHQSRTIKHTHTVSAISHLSQGQELLTKKSPCTVKYRANHPLTNSTKEPVFKRNQNETPEGEDDCKNNHYQALKKSNILKANDYQKPKDIGREPLHVYENFGTHDDHTEV